MGSAVSDWGAAAGQHGEYGIKDLVKNKNIQSAINDLISKYGQNTKSDSTDLSSFIKDYLGQTPQAQANATQESNAIGGFYNGDVARQLADYRAQQSQLGQQAVTQALAQNRGNMNRSMLGGGGAGDSSWLNRYGMGMATNLDLQNNLSNINQARTDYGNVLDSQVGLSGRRTALQDAVNQRQLVPMGLRDQMMGTDISGLTGITNLNNSNNMFGVEYNPSDVEKWGALTSAGGATGMQIGSMGMGSGGGGGKTGSSGGGGGSGASTPFSANSMGINAASYGQMPSMGSMYTGLVGAQNPYPWSYQPPEF